MFKINGAVTSFSFSDEPGSPENDEPDENPDELNGTLLSSLSAQNRNPRWENHVYIQHDDQVGPQHLPRVWANIPSTDTE